MHEAKLCLSIVRMAEEVLAREHAAVVHRVELAIGELSGVAPEALEAAFPICASGTPVEGAALDWRLTPGRDLRLSSVEVG